MGGYAASLVNHDNEGGGDGKICSDNPVHKVGMIVQRILKVPSLISLGALEQKNFSVRTYLHT